MIYQNILKTIGNTPMVRITNVVLNPNINLFAKLEGQNPSGSIKDRVALYLIEQAEKRGELTKDKIILEATSGNMGISLALIGGYKGYKVQILMSEAMSEERKIMLRSLGAELVLTDKNLGTKGAIKKAKKMILSEPNKYWFSNQFNNFDNIKSHYLGLAEEILLEVKDIKMLIAGVGTSGTIMGIAKKFKEKSPNTKIIGVLPPSGYKIQGIQNPTEDFFGNIYHSELIDKYIPVSVEDAYKATRRISKKEGLFLGMSSGAALFVALQKIKNLKKGNVVVIFPDRGEKYLSTDLFRI